MAYKYNDRKTEFRLVTFSKQQAGAELGQAQAKLELG